jgi:DNA-binding transcriptional LysR family regulator
MMLSLVSQSMGVGFVNETARWRCPESVVILNVTDLKMPLLLSLVWRNDNSSALLKRLVEVVGSLLETRVARGR